MLGVCYYPEHWNEDWWAEDARRMRALGISYVRIAEFAWSRMEPSPGVYDWDWLDRAIAVLAAEGLKVVLGTPTAAAPKWLCDLYPEILPVFEDGRARGYGSRRHATAASARWRAESARITEAMAKRYGDHEAVVGWQIDNELGSDDTVLLYGPEDAAGFRQWLAQRYQSPQALNRAWGNVFWSMEVNSFDEVIPPGGAVSETNPAARLDFWRYSSDSLSDYCALQAEIIRKHSPGRFVTHNFMGYFLNFDHYKMSESLDFCSWDSYPLGRVEHFPLTAEERVRWCETSHPDFSAFSHELYRGIGGEKFWIMEQQPGPVNWAHWNPAPKPGMVRLWSWEALAHGAEVVSYFRWRQFPHAQEQMHAGLLRPDQALSPGGEEVAKIAAEIEKVGPLPAFEQAPVALILDYEASWLTRIQPQGADFDYKLLIHLWYEAARLEGVDVEVVAPGRSLSGYKLVLVPSMPIVSEAALAALRETDAQVLFGPRSGSKVAPLSLPWTMPPGPLQDFLPVKVAEVSSLRPGVTLGVSGAAGEGMVTRWRERLETTAEAELAYADGMPALIRAGRFRYLGAWAEPALLRQIMRHSLAAAGIPTTDHPDHVRLRRRGDLTFAFNYGPDSWQVPPEGKTFLLGGPEVAACDVACWRSAMV